MESYFECFVLSPISFFKSLVHFYVANMEHAKTFHKEKNVRSYKISFKLEVVEFTEKKSILAAALKYKLDWHSVRDCNERKERVIRTFELSNKKRKRLQGGGRKTLSQEVGSRNIDID